MSLQFSPKNNPRVIIIQKLYGKFFNDEEKLDFPKHGFRKFIKDVVFGTIERNEILIEELDKNLDNELAKFTARVDLPTPPFPLAIAIIFLIFLRLSFSSFSLFSI